MEALVAVGLAGNVVQFIQGAGALLALAKEIRHTGRPSSLAELERLSQSLVEQTGVLQSRLEASAPTLTVENQNLLDVTKLCHESGTDLVKSLKTLSSSSSGRRVGKVVRIFKKTLKYQWAHGKIEDFAEKLDRLRGSLILATVLALRTSTEDNHRKILDHLEELQREHQSSSQSKDTVLGVTLEESKGTTSDVYQSVHTKAQSCAGEILALRKKLLSSAHPQWREIGILNWLDFRQNSWRHDGIDEAYSDTYEWIFNESDEGEAWSSFSDHLEENVSKPYFINGKAGSGKSTLMKYIFRHLQTVSCLKQWAGTMEPVRLQYFFWNLGTTLQKSYVGMLRTFLHAVLEKHPELIPIVFPKQYHDWNDLATESNEPEPTYIELKKAFEVMIERCHYLKLAIFVDGIDEFEGDHRDMSLFLRSLASDRVKLVISSRPLNTCLEAFVGCPTLRLQDLTREDMSAFVRGNLTDHRLMIRLAQQFPFTAPKLVTEIVDKAEGVFLWVKVVVSLLVKGLENGDTLEELQAMLYALPSDLRDLYKRMFGRLDMEYQKQSALLFGLKEEWLRISPDRELPGAVLWSAINCPSMVFQQPINYMSGSTFDFNMSSLAKRIESRTYGFLELRYGSRRLDGSFNFTSLWPTVSIDQVGQLNVTYLHRTVHEFITADEIWQDICDLANGTHFTIRQRLASACVSMMKLATYLRTPRHDWYIGAAIFLCHDMLDDQPEHVQDYLKEMDRTLSQLHARARNNGKGSTAIAKSESETLRYASYMSDNTYTDKRTLLSDRVSVPEDLDQECRCLLVLHALSSWVKQPPPRWHATSRAQWCQTLTYLLANILRPETELAKFSLWKEAVSVCAELKAQKRYLDMATLLKTFLTAAESPAVLCEKASDPTMLGFPVLLSVLKNHVRESRDRETARIIDEIQHLANLPYTNMQCGSLPISPSRATRSTEKGPSKAKKRRAKKQARRAAG